MVIRFFLFLAVTLCVAYTSFAQQEAITSEGQHVILHQDGTWTYKLRPEERKAITRLEIPRTGVQDKVITHTGYSFVYSEVHEQALWVAYELTAAETAKAFDRSDRFQIDPAVSTGTASDPDYAGSGFDRGHLAPAADMSWSERAMEESFYYSNMSPQTTSFNRGVWKRLEEQVRDWAIAYTSVHVATGPILRTGLPVIGPNRVSVPEFYYKVILDYHGSDVKAIGFLMANQASSSAVKTFALSVDSVEQVTGLDFFPSLSDDEEKKLESEVCVSCWSWTGEQTSGEQRSRAEGAFVRCSAINQSGERCKRTTQSQNGRCYQHGGK